MNDHLVDAYRLELLLELSRLGSMREVGEAMHVTTSTVSQQIAALAREAGTALVEPDGRRVRLTPAGRRLAGHAVTILAAIEAARRDLDPAAPPAGTVRVAAYASAFRVLLPVVRILASQWPEVRLRLFEHEPAEALALLAADEIDLALTYDYNLAPARLDGSLQGQPLGPTPWSLGTPSMAGPFQGATAVEVLGRDRDSDWIVNSRNTADEEVIRIIASLAGFEPRVTQRADSLDLVQDMILAGLGVGLLPALLPTGRTVRGVTLRRLRQPEVVLRPYAVTRRGHDAWPPLALVLRLIAGTQP